MPSDKEVSPSLPQVRLQQFLSERSKMRGLDKEQIAGANEYPLLASDIKSLIAENERLRELLDASECSLSDEEAAHHDTLRLLHEATEEVTRLRLQLSDAEDLIVYADDIPDDKTVQRRIFNDWLGRYRAKHPKETSND